MSARTSQASPRRFNSALASHYFPTGSVTWEEWITLPIREQDEAVHTVRGQIRVPTVIVAVNYAKVPKKRSGSFLNKLPLPLRLPHPHNL